MVGYGGKDLQKKKVLERCDEEEEEEKKGHTWPLGIAVKSP